MVNSSILTFPDPSETFILDTDASDMGWRYTFSEFSGS